MKIADFGVAKSTESQSELTQAGFLSCLIPETYGGSGLGLI